MDNFKDLYNGTVTIKGRSYVELNCIDSISSFDSDYLKLSSKWGSVIIYGKSMNIISLDKDNGIIKIEGVIDEVSFDSKKSRKNGGLFN